MTAILFVYRRRDGLQGKTGPEGCQNQAVEESERHGWIIEGKGSLLEVEKAGSGSPFSLVSKDKLLVAI